MEAGLPSLVASPTTGDRHPTPSRRPLKPPGRASSAPPVAV